MINRILIATISFALGGIGLWITSILNGLNYNIGFLFFLGIMSFCFIIVGMATLSITKQVKKEGGEK